MVPTFSALESVHIMASRALRRRRNSSDIPRTFVLLVWVGFACSIFFYVFDRYFFIIHLRLKFILKLIFLFFFDDHAFFFWQQFGGNLDVFFS